MDTETLNALNLMHLPPALRPRATEPLAPSRVSPRVAAWFEHELCAQGSALYERSSLVRHRGT